MSENELEVRSHLPDIASRLNLCKEFGSKFADVKPQYYLCKNLMEPGMEYPSYYTWDIYTLEQNGYKEALEKYPHPFDDELVAILGETTFKLSDLPLDESKRWVWLMRLALGKDGDA